MSSSQQNQASMDQDLIELQPDQQSMVKRLIAPKVIILTFLSLIFISKNIYNIYFLDQTVIHGPEESATPKPKKPQGQQTPIMYKMYGYVIISVVLFILYMIMVRVNDRALLRKIQQQQKQQKEKQQKRLIEQKERIKEAEESTTNSLQKVEKEEQGQGKKDE